MTDRGGGVSHTIFGREAELGAIEGFLDAVPEAPTALVIEGEAGIGKTTIWLEAVRQAEVRGFRVLQARPAESEGMLSYAALSDLVGDVVDEVAFALPAVQQRALDVALLRAEPYGMSEQRTTASAVVAIL
jgi:predicted ATPase